MAVRFRAARLRPQPRRVRHAFQLLHLPIRLLAGGGSGLCLDEPLETSRRHGLAARVLTAVLRLVGGALSPAAGTVDRAELRACTRAREPPSRFASALLGSEWVALTLTLPLGISFFTFQQIAFLVDAHREQASSGNFTEYALFVAFFPLLIAGHTYRGLTRLDWAERPVSVRERFAWSLERTIGAPMSSRWRSGTS